LDPGVYGTDRQAVVEAVAETRIVAKVACRGHQENVVADRKFIECLADRIVGVRPTVEGHVEDVHRVPSAVDPCFQTFDGAEHDRIIGCPYADVAPITARPRLLWHHCDGNVDQPRVGRMTI
jgi:hypothetical protein